MVESALTLTKYDASQELTRAFELLENKCNIHMGLIDAEDFYQSLEKKEASDLESLSDSFVACPGGTFRSRFIAMYMERKGIKFCNDICRRGFTILDLSKLIGNGTVSESGYLIPEGFIEPLKTLVLPLDTKYEGRDHVLINLLSALFKLCKSTCDSTINLNIVIVNGDEGEGSNLHRKYYEGDLGPAPEIGPNAI